MRLPSPTPVGSSRAFGRLLRRWRDARGVSQLALAGAAGVSPRHLSFLESGRSRPSRDMTQRLATALDLPLHGQNELLEAAGFVPAWKESERAESPPGVIADALERMLAQQEPYPLVVMNRHFDVLRTNGGALRLLAAFLGDRPLPTPLNTLSLLFAPDFRPFVVDWERTARQLLAHAYREAFRHPEDRAFAARLRALGAFDAGTDADLAADGPLAATPVFALRLAKGDLRAAFLTTLTVFNAPQSAAIEQLRIESYFPLDRDTEVLCHRLAGTLSRVQAGTVP